MAVLAGVLAAVLPVVRVTVVAAAEGTLATSAWAALTAADACGAIALAIFWSDLLQRGDGATGADDDVAIRVDADGGGTEQPAGFDD